MSGPPPSPPSPAAWPGTWTGSSGRCSDAGIPVGISQAVDAAEILTVVDLLDREQSRHGLAAVLLQRPPSGRPTTSCSTCGGRCRTGRDRRPTTTAEGRPGGEPGGVDARPAGIGRRRPGRADARPSCCELLLDGDEEALRRFAREAVDQLGRGAALAVGAVVLQLPGAAALSPDTLVSQLLAGLLAEGDRGGLAEQVARQTAGAADRVPGGDRGRGPASDGGGEGPGQGREERDPAAGRPGGLPPGAVLRPGRAAAGGGPLARRLAVRLSARRRLGREGRLDFRKTVRASLGTGGVPVVTHHRPRKVHKPELVVLCDVGGSVAGFSHFTLMLTQALREHFTGVRAFAFVDTTDEVTRFFRPGADVVDAVARIGREADVVGFDGHSDYGTAFEVFADRWASAVGPKTSLLVLGDGRTNYRPPGLPVLADLVRRSRSAHWLNPEPRRLWGSGDSAADRYGEVIDMVECRNAAQLADFVTTL